MNHLKNLLLCLTTIMLHGNVQTQNVDFKQIDAATAKTLEIDDEKGLKIVSYNSEPGKTEIVYDKGDGKEIKKTVTYDKKFMLSPRLIFGKIYFLNRDFKKDVISHTIAEYDIETNKLGAPKDIFTVSSKSEPLWSYIPILVSENGKYFAITVEPGKKASTTTATYFYTSGKAIAVIDANLKVLYQVEIPYQFEEKDFTYDIVNTLGNDGTWYMFGMQYTGKGDSKQAQYGVFETTPDGKTSEFQKLDFDKNYISDLNTHFSGNKLIQYGIWSNSFEEETLSGSFYMELNLQTMKTENEQYTTFTTAQLNQFNYAMNASKIEKKGSVEGIVPITLINWPGQLGNGNYVAVYRRQEKTSLEGYDIAIGSILVSQYGPESKDMINTIIPIDQHSPGQLNFFEVKAAILKNNIVVVFNDNQANENITTSGEPKFYDPLPLKTNTTATFAAVVNEKGEYKRFKLASLTSENVIFQNLKVTTDENLVIVKMKEDPKKIVDNMEFFLEQDDESLKSYLLEVKD